MKFWLGSKMDSGRASRAFPPVSAPGARQCLWYAYHKAPHVETTNIYADVAWIQIQTMTKNSHHGLNEQRRYISGEKSRRLWGISSNADEAAEQGDGRTTEHLKCTLGAIGSLLSDLRAKRSIPLRALSLTSYSGPDDKKRHASRA